VVVSIPPAILRNSGVADDFHRSQRRMARVRVAGLVASAVLAVTLALPARAEAANCGRVGGTKIVSFGGLPCTQARSIYRRYTSHQKLPAGWICGLSARECAKGKRGFTFGFN
jgi:hypothetical protein